MTNPYTGPIPPPPPPPRPPDTRPLHKRTLVWLGAVGLLIVGVGIGATGEDGQQTVGSSAKPTATVTATATTTAKPEPAPTVTETVKAKAKPRPTVTVTKRAPAKSAESGTGSGSGSGGGGGTSTSGGGGSSAQDSTGKCSIRSNAGNCYAAGQFCRNADHGSTTSTADGRKIKCAQNGSSWRWTYA